MGENQESFRDKLVNLAQIVEIAENTFKDFKGITVNVELGENEFNYISKNLNNNLKENKAIISIGSVEFIFLKK